MGNVLSTLFQVMKFSSPNGKGIMELHGDQMVAVKDYFIVSESSGVMPIQKKALEKNP